MGGDRHNPGDASAAAIATVVLIGLAPLNPAEAWRQPIIRLADTIIGAAFGLACAWVSLRLLKLGPAITGGERDAGAGRDA